MPMYTKIEFLEHFDNVDCVYFDFSQITNRAGTIGLYFFIGPELVFRKRFSNDTFRSYVVYNYCVQRRLMYLNDSARVYRSFSGSDPHFQFIEKLFTLR